MKKNIEDCIKELNKWVESRPYYNEMVITYKNKTGMDYDGLFGCSEGWGTDIHCWIGILTSVVGVPTENREIFLMEYIEPILIKYKIKDISIGVKEYKFIKSVGRFHESK